MSYEHIFNELEITTEPFALCELRGASDLGLGQEASATLHYILAGEGEISIRNHPSIKVKAGTLVLIPALHRHSLRSFGALTDPIPSCKPAELKLAHLMKGSENADTGQLIALCTHVKIGLRGASDMISLIREPLIETVSVQSAINPMVSSLLKEISNPGLGSKAMIRSILTQCIIELLRTRIKAQDDALNWMTALKDQSVWNALRAMLDAPGEDHSVDSLAARVGMSRSAFAKRFSDVYGSGPMDLLRDLRMRLAGSLLADTDLPVKRVAELVGFSSRSAFTRMFEKKVGQSPRQFRTSQKEELS